MALAAVKPEKHEPVDVAAMLVYARNIEALEDLSESPGLWQLLTAASSCLGNEYASRLATLALTDRFKCEAEPFPLLTHCVEEDGNGKYVSVCAAFSIRRFLERGPQKQLAGMRARKYLRFGLTKYRGKKDAN